MFDVKCPGTVDWKGSGMPDLTIEQFKEGLEDALFIITKLAPHCRDFGEMLGLIELATGSETHSGNAAQLRILYDLVYKAPQPQQRR